MEYLKYKQHNVLDYLLINQTYISIQEGMNSLFLDGKEIYKITLLENIESVLYLNEDEIILRDDLNQSIIFNLKTYKESYFLRGYRVSEVYDQYVLFYIKKPERKYGIYDSNLNIIITESMKTDLSHSIILNNKIIKNIEKKEIEIYDLSSHENSIFSLSSIKQEYSFIKQIIGIYNNLLWLHIDPFRILGIDITSGKVACDIPDIRSLLILSEEDTYSFVFSVSQILHLDKNLGLLKFFANRYYVEIDLNTLSGMIKKDFGANSIDSWNINKSKFYEGDKNLYFIGTNKNESTNRAVGIFDTEQCEIIYYDEPLEQKKFLFFSDVPQANNKILCVLDSENVLRVYNRVNSNSK